MIGITYHPETRPAVANLLEIMSALSGESIPSLVEKYKESGHAQFKQGLSDVVVDKIAPISKRIAEVIFYFVFPFFFF